MASKMLVGSALLSSIIPIVLGCAEHDNHYNHPRLGRRQVVSNPGRPVTDWAYEASYDWGRINPGYELCQTGTQQSPIPLTLNQGLSTQHVPDFSGYSTNVTGNFYNWGYGPAYTLHHADKVYTTLPAMKFDDETVYLKGWHIHAPADHTVNGDRSKAELHFVHVNAEGKNRAVVGFRLDPGSHASAFFKQLPERMIHFNDTSQMEGVSLNHRLALDEVDGYAEFWTYKGSLTSPPCDEGIQWFMARSSLYMSVKKMQEILRVSTFSARSEQEVWLHEINV